jgi:hypothetical protein
MSVAGTCTTVDVMWQDGAIAFWSSSIGRATTMISSLGSTSSAGPPVNGSGGGGALRRRPKTQLQGQVCVCVSRGSRLVKELPSYRRLAAVTRPSLLRTTYGISTKTKSITVETHDLTWKTPPMRRAKTTGTSQQQSYYLKSFGLYACDGLQENQVSKKL